MKTLTVHVPDEVYEVCQQGAARQGQTIDEYVLDLLSRNGAKPRRKLTEEESRAAWNRLRRHAGSQSLGYPTGADNESIDADLAREYGDDHREKI
ncbi:MAG: hypothetical protein FJ279_30275 [Planctomycetes bacterium]|nr:hypothetical protein [Planctomycetota bacterium]MBM4080501.1 hypothetical protein [Planctomycetota bacterium]